jgi:hypothetical protein
MNSLAKVRPPLALVLASAILGASVISKETDLR